MINKFQQWTGYNVGANPFNYGFHNTATEDEVRERRVSEQFGARERRASGPLGASSMTKSSNNSYLYQVSETCMNHTEMYISGLLGMRNWAMMMFDAAGKLPSEVLKMNTKWLGSYDECRDVRATIVHNETGDARVDTPFKGRYCTVRIPFVDMDQLTPAARQALNNGLVPMGLSLGVCVPNSCSPNDVTGLINSGLPPPRAPLVYDTACPVEEQEWDTFSIASMTVVGVFLVTMLLSSTYDFIYVQMMNEGKQNPGLIHVNHVNIGISGRLHQALISFSVFTNAAKILNTKQAAGNLSCINGVRFFSMTWVLLGHCYVFTSPVTQNFMVVMDEQISNVTFQAVANALVSVDSFFTISGLLVAYLSLREMKKEGGMINMGMFYFHRFWRLTPPYMLVLLVYVPLFRFWGDGPFWPDNGIDPDYCKGTWWTNLIYLNNFIKTDEGLCMVWSWYLANDMQMYVVSPLIFISLFYSKRIGGLVTTAFLLGTTIATGVISKVNHLPPSSIGGGENREQGTVYFIDYYIKSYCRIGPYIMGMLTGYFLYKTDCKIKMNKAVVVFCWLASTFCALAVLYGLYDAMNGHPLTENVSAVFNAVHRTVWGACLCWVIFACCTGYGGIVNTILSWSALVPLSRLTYTMYLIHPIITYAWVYRHRQLIYFTTQELIYIFFATLIVCYAVAFVVSLAFEAPFMSLEKAMFPKKKKNPKYTIELDSDNKDPFPDTGVSSNDVESITKPSIDGFQNNGYFVAAAKYDLTKDLEGGYVNNGGIFTDEQCDLPDGLIDGYRVSERCMNHTEMYISGLLGMQNWAMMMFDAGGKLPSEVFRMNTNWVGSFDECQSVVAAIVHNSTGTATVENPFRGRYCTVSIPFVDLEVLPPEQREIFTSGFMQAGISIGVCIPNSCSSSDVKGLISSGLPLVDKPYAYSALCPKDEIEWDTRSIACMTVIALFMAVMLISSAYDYIYLQLMNDGQLKPGRVAQALLSFSVYTNGTKILNTKSPPGNLSCLNGIRFLSMTWVLYGHIYTFAASSLQGFMFVMGESLKDITFQAVANALVSVDTFFTLSGLLVAYLSLKEMKKGGMINLGMFYFHRFWRLTPPFMLVMMVWVALFRYWGDGPFWKQDGLEPNFCEDTWWTNFIYLANFIKRDNPECMGWVWYLMNDMQMYIVSPLIFISLFYSKWLGGIVSMAFLLGTSIAAGVISKVNHLPPNMVGGGENQGMNNLYFDEYYVMPYCRMGPYIVGMLTGYFLYKTDCKVKMNKAVVLFGWLASTFCALAVLYGLYDGMNPNIPYSLSENVSALFNAVHRTVWGGCVCWVIFACSTGYGGIVNTILSWNALLPLSRLTYMMYLIHPIVISWWALRQRQLFYHTTQNM
ncbi:hypothetical protein ScPMuIL_010407, partial [Solemya velum]